MKRGEFDLGIISLSSDTFEQEPSKFQIANRYKEFLQIALIMILKKMNYRGGDDRTHEFIETFLAIAYFRIPKFRPCLLECMKTKSFYEIQTFHDVNGSLEENPDDILLPMLNWNKLFHQYLPESDNDSLLEQWLRNKSWRHVISKRKLAYFRFIRRWIIHVRKRFVSEAVAWTVIPGYSTIL